MKKLICVFLILILLNNNIVYAESNKVQEIDIETTPTSTLFNLVNMVPGDSTTREIIIKNNGLEDFYYLLKSELVSGSQKLYDSLQLIISLNEKELYNGNLGNFNKLDARYLQSSKEEALVFLIKMPYDLGNDYQGLSSEFEFIFYVEGTLGGALPVDNKLPFTGTGMFNLLATGAVILFVGLILFVYVNRKKTDIKRT